jgi:membrane protease YdiL (CAAX protease family)
VAVTGAARGRLLAALALPTVLGGLGLWGLGTLPAGFWLYLIGGCLLGPWLLLGARPLAAGPAGLTFRLPEPARWRRLELGLVLVFGPLFAAGYLVLRPALGDYADYLARLAALGIDLEAPLAAGVVFVVLNPLVEEWWWRGQATPRCCAAFGRWGGLALVTLAFGLYHVVLLGALFTWPIAVVRAAMISAVSLLWSDLALRQGGWRSVYLAHLVVDVAMAVLFAVVVWPGR